MLSARQMGQMKFRLLVFLAFEILCGAWTHAQHVSDSTPVLHRGANLVLVPTLIRTSTGEPVFGLTANDFILTDDGIEQKIALEEDTDRQPLALVIVVQTGGAGGRRLDSYRRLGPLLDSMVGAVPHHVAVVGFDSEPHIETEFTPDLNNVAGVMANLQPGNGGAAILDSLSFAVDLALLDSPTSTTKRLRAWRVASTMQWGAGPTALPNAASNWRRMAAGWASLCGAKPHTTNPATP